MVCARMHDRTVAEDYFAAMDRIEQRLQIAPAAAPADGGNGGEPLNGDEREQLLDLAEQLTEPGLSPEVRMDLVDRMRLVLNHNGLPEKEEPMQKENGRRERHRPGTLWVPLPPSFG
jgi:hypothetical protein